LSDADVRRLLRAGVLVRLAHGLLAGYRRRELADTDPVALALRVQAMQRRYPTALAAYRTAATLHELWLVGKVGPVHLVREGGRVREKHDVWVEPGYVSAAERQIVYGVEATAMLRTVTDLACRLGPAEALAVADSALRRGLPADALAAAAASGEWAGLIAGEVLKLADRRSESALESISRWVLHEGKLPPPGLQAPLIDDGGDEPFAWVDFYWEEEGVVCEADGMLKYINGPVALRAEKLRQERIERMDLRVVRWGFDEATKSPRQLVRRVGAALARRRAA